MGPVACARGPYFFIQWWGQGRSAVGASLVRRIGEPLRCSATSLRGRLACEANSPLRPASVPDADSVLGCFVVG